MSPEPVRSKREKCLRCQRPLNYCYCSEIKETEACIDLIILQHPKETHHPMNTARIAEIGFRNCQIFVGEDFSDNRDLKEILSQKKCALLFPGKNAVNASELTEQDMPEMMIILDGTWRKARKIFHCNPVLQALPSIFLDHNLTSDYRIRKVPSPEALSTIEAAVVLLRQIDKNKSVHQSLLNAFDKMIQMQINRMGKAVYEKNYAHRN